MYNKQNPFGTEKKIDLNSGVVLFSNGLNSEFYCTCFYLKHVPKHVPTPCGPNTLFLLKFLALFILFTLECCFVIFRVIQTLFSVFEMLYCVNVAFLVYPYIYISISFHKKDWSMLTTHLAFTKKKKKKINK